MNKHTMRTWVCENCGTLVVASDEPEFKWDDGHACRFVLAPGELGRDICVECGMLVPCNDAGCCPACDPAE